MENKDKQFKNTILNKILFTLCALSVLITFIFFIWFIVERKKAFNVEIDILNVQPLRDIVEKDLYKSNKVLGYLKNSLSISVLLLILNFSSCIRNKKNNS